MMPTKVTLRGRPVFGNEKPDTASMSSLLEHLSAHYKPLLAAGDQRQAQAATLPPSILFFDEAIDPAISVEQSDQRETQGKHVSN
jgi:hypothetical protein